MLPWIIYQMNELRRHEWEREAEDRKRRWQHPISYRLKPPYAPLLAKLGRLLVNTGRHLQERYQASGRLVAESSGRLPL